MKHSRVFHKIVNCKIYPDFLLILRFVVLTKRRFLDMKSLVKLIIQRFLNLNSRPAKKPFQRLVCCDVIATKAKYSLCLLLPVKLLCCQDGTLLVVELQVLS